MIELLVVQDNLLGLLEREPSLFSMAKRSMSRLTSSLISVFLHRVARSGTSTLASETKSIQNLFDRTMVIVMLIMIFDPLLGPCRLGAVNCDDVDLKRVSLDKALSDHGWESHDLLNLLRFNVFSLWMLEEVLAAVDDANATVFQKPWWNRQSGTSPRNQRPLPSCLSACNSLRRKMGLWGKFQFEGMAYHSTRCSYLKGPSAKFWHIRSSQRHNQWLGRLSAWRRSLPLTLSGLSHQQ